MSKKIYLIIGIIIFILIIGSYFQIQVQIQNRLIIQKKVI